MSIVELNQEQRLEIELRRAELREAALDYALHPDFKRETSLYTTANTFSRTLLEFNLPDYWVQQMALLPVIDGP